MTAARSGAPSTVVTGERAAGERGRPPGVARDAVDVGRPTCRVCRRPRVTCLCDEITSAETRTRFVILMHPMEYRRERVGTGRLTHLSLARSEIRVGVDFRDDPVVAARLADPSLDCRLLYPGDRALNLSREPYRSEPGRELALFLIDATWPCARKILRSSENLRGLPRVAFDVDRPSEFSIKHQPAPECLATIEAVGRVLERLGACGYERWDDAAGDRLLRPFRAMIERQRSFAADPAVPSYRSSGRYREPSERRASSKHARRGVILRD